MMRLPRASRELGTRDGAAASSQGENPAARARAMVSACTHYEDPAKVARASTGLASTSTWPERSACDMSLLSARATPSTFASYEPVTSAMRSGVGAAGPRATLKFKFSIIRDTRNDIE